MLKENLKNGDKVRIAKAPLIKNAVGWVSPEMDNNIGKIGEVEGIESGDYGERADVRTGEGFYGHWWYPLDCLEPLESVEPKFKKGDKVRVARKVQWDGWVDSMDKYVGDVGVIRSVNELHCKVEFEDKKGCCDSWNFPNESLEKYDYCTAQEKWIKSNNIQIGDSVVIAKIANPYGWMNVSTPTMQENIGNIGTITDFYGKQGVEVKVEGQYPYSYPFQSLEKLEKLPSRKKFELEDNGFRKYSEDEVRSICKIFQRAGFEPDLSLLVSNFVRFEALGDFTTCVIIDHTGEMFVGASKRAKRDKPNPKVGEIMALRRAILESNAY